MYRCFPPSILRASILVEPFGLTSTHRLAVLIAYCLHRLSTVRAAALGTRLGSLSLSRRLHRSDIPSPNLAPAVLSLLLHPNEDPRLCFPSLFFSRDPFSAPNSHGLTSVRLMNLLLSFCHISCCTPSHSSISRNLLLHLLLRMDQSLHKAECVGVDACADIGLRLVIISELRTLTLHESNVTSRLVAVVQTRVRVFLLLYESGTHLYW